MSWEDKAEDYVDNATHFHTGYCCGWVLTEGQPGHCLKTHFPPWQIKWYYQGIQEGDVYEKPLCNSYTTTEVKGMENSMVQSGKESQKIITMRDLLKPIVKNLEQHPISFDSKEMEYRVPNPLIHLAFHITVQEISLKTKAGGGRSGVWEDNIGCQNSERWTGGR